MEKKPMHNFSPSYNHTLVTASLIKSNKLRKMSVVSEYLNAMLENESNKTSLFYYKSFLLCTNITSQNTDLKPLSYFCFTCALPWTGIFIYIHTLFYPVS